MKLIREMKLVKDRVNSLLIKYPHLRDSDNKLIATMWKFDIMNRGLRTGIVTAHEFLELYAQEQLTNAETIRRVRQKIQEENPELRGINYNFRQEQNEQVKKEINE